ncbi:hypothetical protein HPP92_019561 [Vanilla planifolia]|uniref:Uncharacterized protein n=1 Tax=Vanilla planifolia TaxID=51239 RepID=A0A835UJ15_VANPL|nr:hypothetical protein HPP92_019561 [Vanilla planifolia]
MTSWLNISSIRTRQPTTTKCTATERRWRPEELASFGYKMCCTVCFRFTCYIRALV